MTVPFCRRKKTKPGKTRYKTANYKKVKYTKVRYKEDVYEKEHRTDRKVSVRCSFCLPVRLLINTRQFGGLPSGLLIYSLRSTFRDCASSAWNT